MSKNIIPELLQRLMELRTATKKKKDRPQNPHHHNFYFLHNFYILANANNLVSTDTVCKTSHFTSVIVNKADSFEIKKPIITPCSLCINYFYIEIFTVVHKN